MLFLKLNSKAIRGTITGDTTLEEYRSSNAAKLPGEYRVNGAIITTISTSPLYGVLLLLASHDTQILLVSGGKAYIRDYTGNPKNWTTWKKYTYAEISSLSQ